MNTNSKYLNISIFLLIISCFTGNIQACSMYKLTFNDKTIVGNNEDSWRLTSQIWFEQTTNDKFGVAYVGYSDKPHPDGGMNEHGLVFDAFTMPYKSNIKSRNPEKADFSYQGLKKVMQQCKTVEEVYAFLSQYNLHFLNGSILFNGGMLLFADKTGKYLSIEADTMIMGSQNKFVLANFSVAATKDLSTIKTERYCKGVKFLENKSQKDLNTSLDFCTALSDTMSVCRKKVGDGTLYTTIYDLHEGMIYLYFFHDYKNLIKFNLKEELAKGNHTLSIPNLFPTNLEYANFASFQTPQNNKIMFGFVLACVALFLMSSAYFFIDFLRTLKAKKDTTKLFLSGICLALCYYSYILISNQGIFYFPSPYQDYNFSIINIAAYTPFALLLAMFPLLKTNFKVFKQHNWTKISTGIFALNNLTFLTLIGLFTYWGLFNIFN